MIPGLRVKRPAKTLKLTLLTKDELPAWLKSASKTQRKFIESAGFAAKSGELLLLPGADGAVGGALAGITGAWTAEDIWTLAGLSTRLPAGAWALDPEPKEATRAALGWALGCYRFARYRKAAPVEAELVVPKSADAAAVARAAEAATLVRDLINTPAEDMGPGDLARAAKDLAKRHGMAARIVKGDDLLKENYPLIHAVGRAGTRSPRLIDLTWGDPAHPKVTLVGKGVCFDSGGLDLKPADGMKLMKKDMGGSAHVLGLAHMIMMGALKVRLRVLVAAVDNMVAGNSFKPLDVIKSRLGKTVEIGNTDAEGRLILADALADASDEKPDLLIDMATLTGAARVALGPDLPAMYCNDEALAQALLDASVAEADPMWRMPLWRPYRARLESRVADMNNIADFSFAGSVIAALFLEDFVAKGIPWIHFDIFAWNPSNKPGRPDGAEMQALRALYALIAKRFG